MRRAHVFTILAAAAFLTAQAREPHNPSVSPAAPSTPPAVSPVDWVIPVVTCQQIEAGGLLEFEMGPTPSSWGSAWRGTPLPSGR
jgi:hypothetical protein